MSLSDVIRDARKGLKLSQAELAEKLKVGTGTVAGWELSSFRPRLDRLRSVARVLRVPYEQLLALAIKEASS